MATKSNSLEKCLVSLENTLKSSTTGRPRLEQFIKDTTSGSKQVDHLAILDFLVECLSILSKETSPEDKRAKAAELVTSEGSRDPPRNHIDDGQRAAMRNPADIAELEAVVRTVFDHNAKLTLGRVFERFVKDELENKTICGVKKKSRTCVTV